MRIQAVGGYSEVGKNMTFLDLGNDAFIFDAGLFLPAIMEVEEQVGYSEKKFKEIGAIPDDDILKPMRQKVRALLVTHAHLDHVGAIPFIAPHYNAPVAATPFTIEFLKSMLKDNSISIRNNLKAITPNSSFTVRGKKEYRVEFINATHSTLQTAIIAVHTDEGVVIYANDFKFDNTPLVGKKPNYKRLRELGKQGVKALVIESLYSDDERKTPSERIARDLLEDVLFTTDEERSGIIATTFSSHIARLKSIVDISKMLNRKILFVGRSLYRYIKAASRLNLVPFINDIQLMSYRNQVEKALMRASKHKDEWMVVCTGHQGEPGSILDRIARGQLPYLLDKNDHVIFSSTVIPSPINIANRKQLEKRLKSRGVRIFSNLHVSGHCGREDLRDAIKMLQPEHVIPAHGDLSKLTPLAELAIEMGYTLGSTVHILQDGQSIGVQK